ncbi:HAD family hydrolase [Streptomyces sp. NPDC047525]|uniref:HAD family hydrolase n=1 Tax=Streptomyces sp. NPDC047525 TaxID=3155264 RepID=UPI0033D3E84B
MDKGLSEQDVLVRLLNSAEAVLLDFDGPICDLFYGKPTAPIAALIKDQARGVWGTLTPEVEACVDSHGLLQCLRDMLEPDSHGLTRDPMPLKFAESVVREFEVEAVQTARPADRVQDLVDHLRGLGKSLVIVSNNAEEPVREYLDGVGLLPQIKGIFGRDPDEPRHMKPDPDCILRALAYLGLTQSPNSCLMVGDQLTDLEAARAAKTPFLGYSTALAAEMKTSGAAWAVTSHQPTIEAAQVLMASRSHN